MGIILGKSAGDTPSMAWGCHRSRPCVIPTGSRNVQIREGVSQRNHPVDLGKTKSHNIYQRKGLEAAAMVF